MANLTPKGSEKFKDWAEKLFADAISGYDNEGCKLLFAERAEELVAAEMKALNDKLVDLYERTDRYADENPDCPISPTITSEAIGIKHSIGDAFNVVYVRKLGKWCLVPLSEEDRREEEELLALSPLALPRQPRQFRVRPLRGGETA